MDVYFLVFFSLVAGTLELQQLDPAVEPVKVYHLVSDASCDSKIVKTDLNGIASNISKDTPNDFYDPSIYCSQYQFNSDFSTAKHCVEQPETCGGEMIIQDSLISKLGEVSEYIKAITPVQSCKELAMKNSSAKTGYHLISLNGTITEVYCNFDLPFGSGPWMRVINVDMSEPGASCPDGLYEYVFPGTTTYPLCDRQHTWGGHCDSVFIPTNGISFTSVAGRVHGWQLGSGGLDGIYDNHIGSPSIDSYYVDGISITYGSPRQHIWTYVGGQGEDDNAWEDCPCNWGSTEMLLSFVGNDYYCESGYPDNDLLWDGKNCEYLEDPCCTNPNLPWFYKELNKNVTEDIEFRMCSSEGWPDESTAVELIEIYVQ